MTAIFNHVISKEDGKEFKGYLALPAGGKGPGLILLHEVYGVNESLKETADRYAQQGFAVLCPNLYWRMNTDASFRPQKPGEGMTDELKDQRLQAYMLMENLDYTNVTADIQQAINRLRENPGCTGKVGMIGLCLGGRCSILAAAHTDIDCGIALYPTRYKDDLAAQASHIKIPFLFMTPVQDPYVSNEEKNLVLACAGQSYFHVLGDDLRFPETSYGPVNSGNPFSNPHITAHFFPNQDHAFCRVNGLNYEERATQKSLTLALTFFEQSLDYKPPYSGPDAPAVPGSGKKCDMPEWC